MSLEKFIKLIREGEPVSPGTPNRPLQQIDQNVNYLWQLIQAAELGSTVYARMQTVESTVELGQPVYLNAVTQQFEAAYASTTTDPVTGYLSVSPQSQVWGIVAIKHHATSADILLFGYAKVDISAAVSIADLNDDGSVPAGIWYLSGSGVGQLVPQQPPVSVPVLKTDTNGFVFVNPKFIDFVENHRHYVFDLLMQPAGVVTPPEVGGTHVIAEADSSLPGWLPADDAVFAGTAPTGAKFGYNLSQNPDLKNIFPPIPLQSASVLMQRPSVWDTSTERKWYGQQLMEDLVVVDRNGIWWMSDCYDEVPWTTTLDTASSASLSYSDCDPAGKSNYLKLYYTRVNFATDNAVVSSLKSIDDRVVITCAGTDTTGTTGDLEIALDLSFVLGGDAEKGYLAFKELDTSTGVFKRGPVAEGVYATSANVVLESPAQSTLDDGTVVHHGNVGVGVVTELNSELPSQLVRLDGVTEEDYPALYLGLPNDNPTSYVVKFEIPTTSPTNVQFRFRARVLGRVSGTLPPLTATYYKVARPSGLTPVDVVQSYTALTGFNPAAATLSAANQAVEVTSDSLSLNAGDIVYVKIERDPEAVEDGYAGEVGIMQQVGVITST